MQIDDFIHSAPRTPFNMPQVSWLAGAVAGLKVVGKRSPSWLWESFIQDVFEMIQLAGEVEPVDPGSAPEEGDGIIGSAFDAIGGYISVTGEKTPEGLYFRVPVRCQKQVKELLSGITLLRSDGEIIIPEHDIPAFLRLVPVEGPLVEWLEQEELV
ncbi:MAG: hypothetical protein RTV41_01020 [Candidatus Thorarchaeota archaeon]